MFKTHFLSLALLLSAIISRQTSAQEKEKTTPEIKQLCEKFTTAVFTKDLDGAMKLVAVPWFDNTDENKTRVLANLDDVQAALKKALADLKKAKEVRLEVVDDISYEQVLAKRGGKFTVEQRQQLDMVLKNTDRLVSAHAHVDGEKGSRIVILIGWRDGQPRVVGVKDP
jgi:hypothetical protein